ncbi:MAG: serine/threonine protein phosphatase [Flavobacteriaceae bacterium]|jgi:serine/threonine protein phosphatase 1|nr:serine/threonine protein phosphatase [Flavobacteriaceae bacterium]
MKRTLVIGDVHGGLRALNQVIEKANVTQNDILIFLGDYVDGWSESPQVIDYLIGLSQKQECIFIRGNHDELLLDWLQSNRNNPMWKEHGGEATVLAYANVDDVTKQKHIDFLKNLQNYYLDSSNRLFVHAGFTNLNGVTYEYFPKMFYWERTLWEMAVSLDKSIGKEDLLYPKRLKLYNEIYIGHTPVTKINKTIPVKCANVWNIDTGAAFSGPLSIFDVDTKEYWQSDPLPLLYPDEKGRN